MKSKPHGNRRDALLNRFGEATLKRITQDYLDGVTVRELAGRLGVSKGGGRMRKHPRRSECHS